MIDTITITYEFIADFLKEDYQLEKLIAVSQKGRKQIGIRFHVGSLSKEQHLDYAKGLFAGMGSNIRYADEFIYVEMLD